MIRLFYNAEVYRGKGMFCEAFAAEDGRFIACGGSEELLKAFPNAEKHDMRGRFICPGFTDSHMHMLNYGKMLSQLDLADKTGALEQVVCAAKDALTGTAGSGWLVGRGWNDSYFADEKRFPERRDLDRVSRDVPVMLTRACGHVTSLNGAALRASGITRDTPDPEGGRIGRDDDGEPNGLLYEKAVELAMPPRPDIDTMRRYLEAAEDGMAAAGITCAESDDLATINDVDFKDVLETFALWKDNAKVRVYEQCNLPDIASLKEFFALGCNTGSGDDIFGIGPLKLLADGSLGARTAYLREGYADMPGTRGMAIYTQDELNERILTAHEHGMRCAVHVIGDGALEMLLNAYGALGGDISSMRHGAVHCQISDEKQIEYIIKYGIHAYVQPIFLDYDTRIVEQRTGARSGTSYAFGTLLRAGCASFGSDCPVEKPDPLRGIQCAVTRRPLDLSLPAYRPDEAVSVAEAIDGFTSAGAFAACAEDRRGMIADGMQADFTVLAENPFRVAPESISTIKVNETWMDGIRRYSAK